MDRKTLERVGKSAYGNTWQTDLAKDLGITDRSIRNWIKNDDAKCSESELIDILNKRKMQITDTIKQLENNMLKLQKAFRTDENTVYVMYFSKILNNQFVVEWSNVHPATGETSDYDLQIKCLANNEHVVERVENAIREGESDNNPDLDLYLAIRDNFNSLDCEDL